MNKNNNNTSVSWPVVIILLIIFWPVGLGLAIYKAYKDKTAIFQIAKILNVVGIVFICFAILAFLALMGEMGADDFGIILFFLIAGILCVSYAKKSKNKLASYKKYIAITVNQNVRNIDEIAAIVKKDTVKVKKELDEMITKSFFESAYIDETRNEIVITMHNHDIAQKAQVENIKTIVVSCKNCGAQSTVEESKTGTCEFCGSSLQG